MLASFDTFVRENNISPEVARNVRRILETIFIEGKGGAVGLAEILDEVEPNELEPALEHAKTYARAQIALHKKTNAD